MNDNLARTLGIEFVKKSGKGRSSADVRISKTQTAPIRYTISFSPSVAKKLGDYVRIAPTEKRVYIAPGCRDEYGWTMTGCKNGKRRYVNITATAVGFLEKFMGEHSIKYDSDLDVYYISLNQEAF